MSESILIVLRGNAASGKSTVARLLQEQLDDGAAWIEQEYLRRTVLGETAAPFSPLSIALPSTIALQCLRAGRHVVLDGIFTASRYAESLQKLAADHTGRTLFFAFDLDFNETMRRHNTRTPKRSEYGESEMRGWFHGWQPLPFVEEARITAEESAEQITRRILAAAYA